MHKQAKPHSDACNCNTGFKLGSFLKQGYGRLRTDGAQAVAGQIYLAHMLLEKSPMGL